MPGSETNRPEQPDRSIAVRLLDKRAELLWGLVAVIMLLTFVNPVVLIGAALVIATVAAGWAGFHELMDRARQDDAKSAPAFRPAPTARPAPEKPSPRSWLRHHAA
jgi:hypothetical protein